MSESAHFRNLQLVQVHLRRTIDRLGGLGGAVLGAALMILLGVWGFAALAAEVIEGDTQTFDEWAIQSLRRPNDPAVPLGPPWLHEMGRDMTALGGFGVMALVTLGVGGYLLIIRKYHAFWLMLAATIGGMLLSAGLKALFARDRPDLVPHLSIVSSSSFPSGHSMLASAVYLTLGALLARLVTQRSVKFYFIAMAMLLAFLVGFSRVYMGVHYPTDVLAGWTAGLVWALFCWMVARHLQHRGTVEKPDEQTVHGHHVPAPVR